jgi:hypothetical protein
MEQAFASWCERAKPLGLDPYVEDYGRPAEARWVEALTAGILERVGFLRPGQFHRGVEPAKLRLVDVARRCARHSNRDDRVADAEIVSRELAHSTGFFPAVLENAIEKILGTAFVEGPSTYQLWTRESVGSHLLTDLKRPSLSEGPGFSEIPELMPIQEGTYKDVAAKFQIRTFGVRFSISRQALVNDDLAAFVDLPASLGRSARRRIDDELYSVLASNPVLAQDGLAVFNAAHANVATGAGSALSSASLATARKLMRRQRGPNSALLGVRPAFLLVPAALEMTGDELLNSIFKPDSTGAANALNTFARGDLTLITEPRLDDTSATKWYLLSSRDTAIAEVAFLNGTKVPTVVREESSPILGTSWTAWLDFGSAVLDYRGAVRSDGA